MSDRADDRPTMPPGGEGGDDLIPRAPGLPTFAARHVETTTAITEVEAAPPRSTGPPPPTFDEMRRLSRHPSSRPAAPPAQASRGDHRRIDSRSFTLPGPSAVPRLLIDASDLSWFDLADEARGLIALIDGVRSISRIAVEGRIAPGEVQLRIADLRDKGLVALK